MNTQWKEFLGAEGAIFHSAGVVHFGNHASEAALAVNHNIMADLSHSGLISVAGSDAITFLQGQMTCDIREVSPLISCLGAFCNPKGRVRITFRLFQREEIFYLALPAECVANTLTQLHKYVLRSKVILKDVTEQWIHLGCAGPTIAEGLSHFFSIVPSAPDQTITEGTTTIIRLRGEIPRFEILGEFAILTKLWHSLKVCAAPIGSNAWATLEVLSGVPVITCATSEAFVPHMLNLPEIGAVSFRKGCYTGQEVVARTQYLGKSKRRLYLVHIADGKSCQVGKPLWTAADEEENSGQIVNIAPAPQGGIVALAVLAVADVEQGIIPWRDQTGAQLKLLPQPYPFLEK